MLKIKRRQLSRAGYAYGSMQQTLTAKYVDYASANLRHYMFIHCVNAGAC